MGYDTGRFDVAVSSSKNDDPAAGTAIDACQPCRIFAF
jgi:hypothetical protein